MPLRPISVTFRRKLLIWNALLRIYHEQVAARSQVSLRWRTHADHGENPRGSKQQRITLANAQCPLRTQVHHAYYPCERELPLRTRITQHYSALPFRTTTNVPRWLAINCRNFWQVARDALRASLIGSYLPSDTNRSGFTICSTA